MQYRTAQGGVWGTVYHITYQAEHDMTDSIIAQMRCVELSLSAFDPASTISRINRGETDSADKMFAEVFDMSLYVNRITGGAFDPTIAPLVNLWGFGYKDNGAVLPDSAKVAEALRAVGIDRCRMNGLTITRADSTTEFDFSAIAKGYGVDCVAAMLRRNGCSNYLVEIGGEVAASGVNPRGSMWRVAVDAPVSGSPGDSAIQIIELDNSAVATSGNYRNFREISPDSVIGHTIDPHTGYPVATSVLSATVTAPRCVLADALATACMAMPPDLALALADSVEGVRIILVTRRADGTWETLSNPR